MYIAMPLVSRAIANIYSWAIYPVGGGPAVVAVPVPGIVTALAALLCTTK